ncbi:MAG: MATE family efflux transporter [Bacteroidetes bacterium GWF2_33_16]|nr:MAG: MATE family efflux transporter [Bacteroidetes bacterium GWE2_32_14]OFY05336.1 MAG: MATE family efflux transporter [Bacteroidetes bacterium GWF2_33_16]
MELWKDIKESIAGTDKDFTNIPLRKSILLLSIPMVLETLMESIFAITDIFFVSKLGPDAIATVGLTESMLTMIYAVGMGLSMATTAMVSRRIGEKKPYSASVIAVQAIMAGIVVSLAIGIPGIIFAPSLLKLMGASNIIVEEFSVYTTIILGSNMVIMLLFIINAVFRSSGDAAISMRVLWLANIVNIVLDPIFIFGWGPIPAMGIKGAALATTIGRGLAVIYQFYLLFKGHGRVRIIRRAIKLNLKVMYNLFKVSLGGIGQSLVATISWVGMVRIIAEYGSNALAGYTIAIRVIIFALMPSWGISNAAATLVGQNLGAKKPERAERAVWITGYVNMVLLGLVSIIFITYPDFFIRLFIDNPDVVKSGAKGLQIISMGYIFYAMGMVMVQSFNGAGDTRTPTLINIVCFWMIEIPLALILSKRVFHNENGVFTAIVIAESLMTLIAIYLFRKGKWKTEKV